MLGGSVPRLATFSIVSNVTVAIAAPLLFTMMGSEADITFLESVTLIATRVVPLIILPLSSWPWPCVKSCHGSMPG